MELPWIRELPVDWGILRGKLVFTPLDVRSTTGSEELLTVSSDDGVVPRSQKNVTMYKAESYLGYKLCWPGDLVINSLWAWARGLGFSNNHGIVSTAYGVYRPRREFVGMIQYFDYLLRSEAYDWELRVRSKGIWTSRLQLTDQSFLDMPIIVPPQNDAEKISIYLRNIDGRIRRLVRRKHRFTELVKGQVLLEQEINLVREYRARLVNDVVIGKVDVRPILLTEPNESKITLPIDEGHFDANEEPEDLIAVEGSEHASD